MRDLWDIAVAMAALIGTAVAIAWLLHAAGLRTASQRCEERLSRIEAKMK